MILLDDIRRIYRVGEEEVRALDGVSLEIERGEFVALMGPSGSGKSTLLHILGLLDRPTSGRYRIDGVDVTDLDEEDQARTRREKIGFVFQFFHLVAYLTAAENVDLPLLLAGVPQAERHERVANALAAMGLSDRARHRPEQLSGGQRQRVAIARATVTAPALILADEPTGNLDRRSGDDVMRILGGLCAQGLTLIVVTHDADVAARAPRCVRLSDGRVVADERTSSAHGGAALDPAERTAAEGSTPGSRASERPRGEPRR